MGDSLPPPPHRFDESSRLLFSGCEHEPNAPVSWRLGALTASGERGVKGHTLPLVWGSLWAQEHLRREEEEPREEEEALSQRFTTEGPAEFLCDRKFLMTSSSGTNQEARVCQEAAPPAAALFQTFSHLAAGKSLTWDLNLVLLDAGGPAGKQDQPQPPNPTRTFYYHQ